MLLRLPFARRLMFHVLAWWSGPASTSGASWSGASLMFSHWMKREKTSVKYITIIVIVNWPRLGDCFNHFFFKYYYTVYLTGIDERNYLTIVNVLIERLISLPTFGQVMAWWMKSGTKPLPDRFDASPKMRDFLAEEVLRTDGLTGMKWGPSKNS